MRVTLASWIGIGLLVTQAAAALSSTPEEAIKAACLGAVEVAERGDTDGYMKYFTEDAIIMGSGLSPVEGASAIRPWIEGTLAGFTVKFIEWNPREVLVFGDAALHLYSGVLTMASKGDAQTTRQERQYLDLMRRGHQRRESADGASTEAKHRCLFIHIGPEFHQCAHYACVATVGSPHERREAVAIAVAQVRASGDQGPDVLYASPLDCLPESPVREHPHCPAILAYTPTSGTVLKRGQFAGV